MIKAVIFDLGGTLIRYKDVPLSWASLYQNAIVEIAKICEKKLTIEETEKSIKILGNYNTRITPREDEVKAEIIFSEILSEWNIDIEKYLEDAIDRFFTYFQRKSEVFEDTIEILNYLKKEEILIGILTDVPYGMSRKYVKIDIYNFEDSIDYLRTSVEVGMRKPNGKGYTEITRYFNIDSTEIIFVGDEEKDIIGAKSVGMMAVYIDRSIGLKSFGEDLKINQLDELIEVIESTNV